MIKKVKRKYNKIPSPFDLTSQKTERTAVSILMNWMRNIIEEKKLDLGLPNVETIGSDRKMPDLIIYESRKSQNVICVIEAKQPNFDIFDEKELKEPARQKASKRGAKYFCVTNFKKMIWFNTQKVNSLKPLEEQIIDKYNLSEIENLDDIEQTRYSEPIKKTLENFLLKLYSVYSGKESEPKLPIDEILIFILQERILKLSRYYKSVIYDNAHKEPSFALKLGNWFSEQGWNFTFSPEDFDKVSRQTAYLLVNKILFYNVLQSKRPQELSPLEIPEGLFKGGQLQKILQVFFDEVLKIDYETIYTTDFIDSIAFPEEKEVVKDIIQLTKILKRYDFSKIGYDVIGRIFERLIPIKERHILGQYFTNPDIVDLILKFCLKHEDDNILDPSCGAGTFLVRAYRHKKLMNQFKEHKDILEKLWGIDIAKFPAHLSTINLAINDLSKKENYPNIIQKDFFELKAEKDGIDLENWRKLRAKTLGKEEIFITYPKYFDAIVGNPPYTRQEEIEEIGISKEKIIENALKDFSGKKIANISKRAGIYIYFFTHGTKFLKDEGYFGFIVNNSWLDVDYGKGLQEFFLKNYKIITIIESKVERWFEDADINTCVVILQKCKEKKEREENLVRFVYLKKPLNYFIPRAEEIFENEIERLNSIEKLKNTILAHNDFYENDDLRIFPKSQKELYLEGFDEEERKYVGSKWGKYLRAPEIFFKILKKCKKNLKHLKQIAKVKSGIKSGANEFFYLTEEEIKRRRIEKQFWMHRDKNDAFIPNYVIESPSDLKSYLVNPQEIKKFVLLIHLSKEKLKNKRINDYILLGEKKGYQNRDTCNQNSKRKNGRWYDLDEISANIIFPEYTRDRLVVFYSKEPIFINNRLYSIYSKNSLLLSGILNSTICHLFLELAGPQPGGGGPRGIRVYDLKSLVIPFSDNLEIAKKIKSAYKNLLKREVKKIFLEIGSNYAKDITLDTVMPDRRELDKIVMGEILGLSEEEQLEVYKAVIDLVRSRIEKAKGIKNKKQNNEIDTAPIKNEILKNIENEE